MGALLAEASFMEDEDARSVLNRTEAMSDDERGASGKKTVEGFANLQLGFGVDAGSGFIEDEEAGVVGEGSREADELALADGESGAALVDARVYAFGESADKIAKADFVDGAFDG
jgi:hypothetical protein